MRRTKRKLTIKGLYLWNIQIETCGLWITTRRNSIEDAIKKARKIIVSDYIGEQIKSVCAHGFIDA